jgi:aminoglycoside phosphotransferase (APT) family kinase protein
MSSVRQPFTEFRSKAAEVQQDWDALARYLAGLGAALGPATPRQFAGGLGNLNYLIEIDGRPAVLRRPPTGPLPPGANNMAREHRILSALWQAYPLAPRALFFCETPAVLGAPFLIVEYRPGIIIRGTLPADLAGGLAIGATLSRHLVESLAALHAIDPAQIGLETLGRETGFLGRTIEGWASRAAPSPIWSIAGPSPTRSSGCAAECQRISPQPLSIPTSNSTT